MLSFTVFAILSSYSIASRTVFDEGACPLGWLPVLDECIKLDTRRKTPENAQLACEKESATLLVGIKDGDFNEPLLKKLIKVLEGLIEDGLLETKWLIAPLNLNLLKGVSQRVWKRKHLQSREYSNVVFARNPSLTYTLDVAKPHTAYPFICSLKKTMRAKLLYQTSFIPKGAPELLVQPESEYYCKSGTENMYISLFCKARGDPSPRIEWFKNGVEKIEAGNGTAKLIINGGVLMIPCGMSAFNSRFSIFANYHCTATNKYGSVRSTTAVIRQPFMEEFDFHRPDEYSFDDIGGVRIDCQAPMHYPKTYSYLWMVGGSTGQFVTIDERVFVSRDGTLFFSYNIPDDAKSYACSLASAAMQGGHYGPFFNLNLSPGFRERSFSPLFDDRLPQIFPENPRVGDTVYIECFAYGRPAPRYYWSRSGGSRLPSRSHKLNHNRVLVINSVKAEDSGEYTCVAENELGNNTSKVVLTVASRPKLLWALQDMLLSLNSTAYFDCQSTSKEATFEWFKNSIPIVPLLMPPEDRKRYSVDASRLLISGVREEDSGIYQCFVSTDDTIITSSALLTVKDEAPRFASWLMPKRVFAIAGSDLVIPCISYSLPTGTVDWFDKFGKKVGPEGRRRHLEDAQNRLFIDEILLHDEGIYVCRVSNRVGISNYEIKIQVLRRPIVSVNPLLRQVSSIEDDVKITCELEMVCESLRECPDISFSWSYNNFPLYDLHQYQAVSAVAVQEYSERNTKLKSKSVLSLPRHLGLHRLGQFVCTSPYGGNAAEVLPNQVFIPPVIAVANASSTTITLSWSSRSPSSISATSSEDFSRLYQVDYRTKANKFWTPISLFSNETFKFEKNLMIFENLKSGIGYRFRISLKEAVGVLDSSSETEWINTLPAPVKRANLQIGYLKLQENQFLVHWSPFQLEDNAQVRYKLKWSTPNEEGTVISAEHSYLIVTKRETAGCYEMNFVVEVLSYNVLFAIDRLSVNISSEAPTRFASKLAANYVTSTSAVLTWQWESSSKCENVRSTEVNCAASPAKYSLRIVVEPDLARLQLENLVPETNYYCTLRAYDHRKRAGNLSNIVHFTTLVRAPSEKPAINRWLVENHFGTYLTTIYWNLDTSRNDSYSDSVISGYKIRIFITETAAKPVILRLPQASLKNLLHPSASLEGLKLLHYYKIQVSAYNEGGEGPLSDPVFLRMDTVKNDVQNSSSGLQSLLFTFNLLLFFKFFLAFCIL